MLILHQLSCSFPDIWQSISGTGRTLVCSSCCWHQEIHPRAIGVPPSTMPCSYSAPGIQFYVIQSALTRRNSNTLSKVLRFQQISALFHCSHCQPSCCTFLTGPVFLSWYREIIVEHQGLTMLANPTAPNITRCFAFLICSPTQNFKHVLMENHLSSQHPNTASQDYFPV